MDEVRDALAELHERRGFLALFVFLTLHMQNVLPPEAATRALPRHERDARLNTRRDADRADCPAGDARKTSRAPPRMLQEQAPRARRSRHLVLVEARPPPVFCHVAPLLLRPLRPGATTG